MIWPKNVALIIKIKGLSDPKMSAELRREKQINMAIERCILYPSPRFTPNELMHKYKELNTKIVVKHAFDFLIENKLATLEQIITKGKLNEKFNLTNGEATTWLIKTPFEEIQNDAKIKEIFNKYGIAFEAYSKSFGIRKRNSNIFSIFIKILKSFEIFK